MSSSTYESIQELLEPLRLMQSTGEYFRQHQSIVDFERSLRELEQRYAALYEQVIALEKKFPLIPNN
jgi:hypothetical protein